jgi:hypothetical protein
MIHSEHALCQALSVGHIQCCTTTSAAAGKRTVVAAAGYYRPSSANDNCAYEALVDLSYLVVQALRLVYKGDYTEGERIGEECACKRFKKRDVFREDSHFAHQIKVVDKSLQSIDKWNEAKRID